MRSQDVAVALALVGRGGSSYPDLVSLLGLSLSETHGAVRRLQAAGLVNPERSVIRQALQEFLIHGLKYVFPAKPGGPALGVPTGEAAPMLRGSLVPNEPAPWVWPWSEGSVRGLVVEPLYKKAPGAALADEKLYELLALVDAIRVGRARERKLAEKRLKEVLNGRA